jgi:hypothetical protein
MSERSIEQLNGELRQIDIDLTRLGAGTRSRRRDRSICIGTHGAVTQRRKSRLKNARHCARLSQTADGDYTPRVLL